MAINPIYLGVADNDGLGDDAKTAGQKINANFEYVETLATQNAKIVQNNYANIAAMLADQVNQIQGRVQFVTDASADPVVVSGYAYYEKLADSTADLDDYRKLSDSEIGSVGIPEAPEDGSTYGRKDAGWIPISSGTPATRKITFGIEAINNTAGQSTTPNEMIAAMNTLGFTINEGELALLEIQVLRVLDGAQWRIFKRYLFKNNNVSGTWGTGSTNGEINYNHLIEVAWRQFIKIEANSEYNDLGDIASSTIEDHLNSLPANTYVLTNLATDYYFTCIRNGTEQVYQVKPLSLPLTISNDTVTSADFDLVASSENPEPAAIPTEEQIKGTAQLELTATGAITATFNTHSMLYINQTGNVTLSVTLPTLAIGEKVTRLIWVKPNGNTFGLPTELTDTMSGEVDVAKTNWIAVTYVRIDGSTIVQFSNCTSL